MLVVDCAARSATLSLAPVSDSASRTASGQENHQNVWVSYGLFNGFSSKWDQLTPSPTEYYSLKMIARNECEAEKSSDMGFSFRDMSDCIQAITTSHVSYVRCYSITTLENLKITLKY